MPTVMHYHEPFKYICVIGSVELSELCMIGLFTLDFLLYIICWMMYVRRKEMFNFK